MASGISIYRRSNLKWGGWPWFSLFLTPRSDSSLFSIQPSLATSFYSKCSCFNLSLQQCSKQSWIPFRNENCFSLQLLILLCHLSSALNCNPQSCLWKLPTALIFSGSDLAPRDRLGQEPCSHPCLFFSVPISWDQPQTSLLRRDK